MNQKLCVSVGLLEIEDQATSTAARSTGRTLEIRVEFESDDHNLPAYVAPHLRTVCLWCLATGERVGIIDMEIIE
jgi:hypothetical protein